MSATSTSLETRLKAQAFGLGIGLVAEVRPVDQVHTIVGTLGYMPPSPEKPGTPQADIYALGMLLYVISTGSEPALFPARRPPLSWR